MNTLHFTLLSVKALESFLTEQRYFFRANHAIIQMILSINQSEEFE
jgi:hypothetical protein